MGARIPVQQTLLGIIEPSAATALPVANRAPYWTAAAIAILLLAVLVPVVGLIPMSDTAPVALVAYGPVEQPLVSDASIRRVAINLEVTNRSNALVFVSPLQFRARDSEMGYHRANVNVSLGADTYRIIASGVDVGGVLGATSLSKGETVTGYVVFDIPLSARLVQIVLSVGNREITVDAPADRLSFLVP